MEKTTSITIYTDGIANIVRCPYIGWGHAVLDPDGKVMDTSSGCVRDGRFVRYTIRGKILAIAQALKWAKEKRLKGVTVLTDSPLAMRQVNGVASIPEHYDPAYVQTVLMPARKLFGEVGGIVARIPWELNLIARDLCLDPFLEKLRAQLRGDLENDIEEVLEEAFQEPYVAV